MAAAVLNRVIRSARLFLMHKTESCGGLLFDPRCAACACAAGVFTWAEPSLLMTCHNVCESHMAGCHLLGPSTAELCRVRLEASHGVCGVCHATDIRSFGALLVIAAEQVNMRSHHYWNDEFHSVLSRHSDKVH